MFDSDLFGILLCIGTYAIGVAIYQKTKNVLFNPFLISMAMIVTILLVTGYPLEQFSKGASYVKIFLLPATCALSLNIYRQRRILKQYFLPVLVGCTMGAIGSMAITYALCVALQLDDTILRSTLPRSITSAIAADMSTKIGGIASITLLCVVFSGIAGAVFVPIFVDKFNLKNKVAVGIGMGSASHVLGTAKALEMGEIEAAMSGMAISISGIITVVLALFIV